MGFFDGPSIVTNGLVLSLDAADRNSYPGSGTAWNDLTLNGNNGTLTNTPTFTSNNLGSFSFNGTNQYVNMGSKFNNISGSICFWIKFTNTITTGYAGNQRPWGKNGNFEARWGGSGTATDRSLVVDINGITNISSSLNEWLNTQWYHIGITYNSINNTSFIYVQGSQNGNGTAGNPSGLTGDFFIGCSSGSAAVGFVNGQIANFQIYNSVLSATEVLQNYNAQKSRFGL